MRRLAVLLIVLAEPSASLSVPDSVPLGETLEVDVILRNPTNVSVTFYIEMVSPYSLSDTRTVPPGGSESYEIYISTAEYRAGERINVTILVEFSLGGEERVIRLEAYPLVVSGSESPAAVNVLLGLLILTIGLSVVGYLAMARRRKSEEREEFARPPRL